ncbi:fimbria/pilus outer membrane usher protein [Providencia huaxiensis]|uniref:fimbria/pilus outer membrane usher protein n=1 Tax=Providencia huaxiensis TaxID=2027290 RepID=UPI003756A591
MLFFLAIPIITNAQVSDDGIEFNSELLRSTDRDNINLNNFSDSSYLPAGHYKFNILLNKKREITLEEHVVIKNDHDGKVFVCLTPDMVGKFGLEDKYISKLTWDNGCLDIKSLPGLTVKPKLSKTQLLIDLPQSYLGFFSENWVPSSLWSNGVTGFFLDYNLTGNTFRPKKNGLRNRYSLSGNGVAGFNLDAWRFRGDWQTNLSHEAGVTEPVKTNFDWSRLYAYTAIKTLKAKLTLGENYVMSDFFSSIRFLGVSLETDMSMTPPSLRGYSPEVKGIAETNATVTIYKDANIIYQTQVPPGPFAITDISDAVTGELLVQVEEQNGKVNEFTVSSNYAPYLTRPGDIRYRIYTGKPLQYSSHKTTGNNFISAESSFGAFNSTSLIAGALVTKNYLSSTYGIAHNTNNLGAISFNLLNSKAKLKNSNYNGNALKIMYTKRFDDIGGSIGASSLRYLDKQFMELDRFVYSDERAYVDQQKYIRESMGIDRITLSQYITPLSLSTSLVFSRNHFRNKKSTNHYQANLNKTVDIGNIKNISLNLSLYQNEFNDKRNNGLSFNVSIPLDNGATMSYALARDYDGKYANRLGYFNRLDNNTNYNLSSGVTSDNLEVSGYINHTGSQMNLTANASVNKNNYDALSLNVRGGLTVTNESIIAHSSSTPGGTRMIIDTHGEKGIPIISSGKTYRTNLFGQVMLPDVNSYYKNTATVNLNKLPKNVSVLNSVVEYSLTDGSIGYKTIEALSGFKLMAIIKNTQGHSPPIGTNVVNEKKQLIGVVDDNGLVYLKGVKSNENLSVTWEKQKCNISIPSELHDIELDKTLLLTCEIYQ